MQKLIADVHPGDTLILKDGSRILVRKITWLTYSPVVTVNGAILFAKTDWVEVTQ